MQIDLQPMRMLIIKYHKYDVKYHKYDVDNNMMYGFSCVRWSDRGELGLHEAGLSRGRGLEGGRAAAGAEAQGATRKLFP